MKVVCLRVFVCVCNISNQCTSHRQTITRPGVESVLETSSVPAHVDCFCCSVCVCVVVVTDSKIGGSTFRGHQDSRGPKGPGNSKKCQSECCLLFIVCFIF